MLFRSALFAPKPQCLISADDWTKEMATKGFPQLQEVYRLLGVPENVVHRPFVHFPHNYNAVSRAAMYPWLNTHLGLGHTPPILEEDYPLLAAADLTVWDDQHPRPSGGDDFERRLLAWLTRDTAAQLAALTPVDSGSLARWRAVVGRGWDAVIGRTLPSSQDVGFDALEPLTGPAGTVLQRGLLRVTARGEELPALVLRPGPRAARTVLWLHPQGKAGLYGDGGALLPAVARLLASGVAVMGVDLLGQGEFAPDGAPITQTRRVKNPREAAAYTFGYNHALFAQRVHDVLTAITFLGSQGTEVWLAGLDGAGDRKSVV